MAHLYRKVKNGRVHFFVWVVPLTYLAFLGQRLRAAGLEISPKEAMEEMRAFAAPFT
jgi:hypothetical protein